MDKMPKDYDTPVYLKGSHGNSIVDKQAVFVDIQDNGLEEYQEELINFSPYLMTFLSDTLESFTRLIALLMTYGRDHFL
eukprot:6409142-Ditylum_brightwellii.AAC.1